MQSSDIHDKSTGNPGAHSEDAMQRAWDAWYARVLEAIEARCLHATLKGWEGHASVEQVDPDADFARAQRAFRDGLTQFDDPWMRQFYATLADEPDLQDEFANYATAAVLAEAMQRSPEPAAVSASPDPWSLVRECAALVGQRALALVDRLARDAAHVQHAVAPKQMRLPLLLLALTPRRPLAVSTQRGGLSTSRGPDDATAAHEQVTRILTGAPATTGERLSFWSLPQGDAAAPQDVYITAEGREDGLWNMEIRVLPRRPNGAPSHSSIWPADTRVTVDDAEIPGAVIAQGSQAHWAADRGLSTEELKRLFITLLPRAVAGDA
ncbi:MAG: hypothetical protein ACKVVP_18485 [Chloroflexota bacterium]